MTIRKKCANISCGKLVPVLQTYCAECARNTALKREKKRRREGSPYTSPRWRKYSKDFLRRNPICTACARELARVVDHVVSVREAPERFWDPSNHTGLCKSCHSKKTAKLDGGFGNPFRKDLGVEQPAPVEGTAPGGGMGEWLRRVKK